MKYKGKTISLSLNIHNRAHNSTKFGLVYTENINETYTTEFSMG